MKTTLAGLAHDGVLSYGDGYRTRKDELAGSGFRIIRVADVTDGRVRMESPDFVSVDRASAIGPKRAQGGDILLTTKGTVGRVAVMPETAEEAVYSPQLCFFRTKDQETLDRGWLKSWFGSHEFLRQAGECMGKTDMAAYINLRDLGMMTITVPAHRDQRAIAEVLGALDDATAANDRVIAQAERLAVALASRGALTVPLAQISEHSRVTTNPGVMGDAIVDHYSLPAYDTAKMPERSHATSILSGKFRIVQPSVLISKLNPRFPRVWDVPTVNNCSVSSTEFIILEPKSVSTSVLWALLSQPSVSDYLCERAAGTSGSHQRVKPHDLLAMPVGDPASLEIQAQDRITGICASVYAKRRQNQALAALRDVLLPELMSGRMRVKDAQQRVEEAI